MVSVIVPTCNRRDTLSETLESVLNQTFQDFEIIVVNDGGEDASGLISRLNRQGNIVYIRHERGLGPSAARNSGVKVAKGKYISYLDDDDTYYPDHLKTLVEFLESTEYKVAYTDSYRANVEYEDGKYVVKRKDLWSFDIDYERILVGNTILMISVMHEKACLDEVGMFDESLWVGEDWDLWIRMSRKFRFAHIKKVTTEFRWKVDGTNLSSSKQTESLSAFERIYEKCRAFSSPSIIKQQENSLRIQRERTDKGTWTKREKLKMFLARFIGVKGIDFLYRLKLKLYR